MFRPINKISAALVACVAVLLLPDSARADVPEFTLVIRDHRFQPAELRVPAGKKLKLIVSNEDATPEEFESYELNREKVIPAKARGHLYIGPLNPGRYPFFGDFHKQTARGTIVAE